MSKTHSRVWLITGCSIGFGRELSEALLAKGDRLIATARNVAQLKDLETSHPTQVLVTQLDVTTRKASNPPLLPAEKSSAASTSS
jgi:NADP-dependent 3-hydroxy acid dehydrogenase YdfG